MMGRIAGLSDTIRGPGGAASNAGQMIYMPRIRILTPVKCQKPGPSGGTLNPIPNLTVCFHAICFAAMDN